MLSKLETIPNYEKKKWYTHRIPMPDEKSDTLATVFIKKK